MKKIYIKKISNKEAKEIFKGEKYTKVLYNGKEANLYGIIDNEEEMYVYSSSNTNRCLGVAVRISEENELTTDDNMKGQVLIIK